MRQTLALFMVIFIVFPCMMMTMFLVGINQWVLDRDFYTEALDNPALYEALLEEDLPEFLQTQAVPNEDQIPTAALAAGLREVTSTTYIRDEMLGLVDEVFDFIEGQDRDMDLSLDITPVKDSLNGDGAELFARALAGNLPTCEAGQEPRAADGRIIRCISPDASINDATESILTALPGWVESLPNAIELTDNAEFDRDMRDLNEFLDATVRNGLASAIAGLAIISAMFWLISAFIGGRSVRSRLIWLGLGLIVPAAVIFSLGGGLAGMSDASAASALDWDTEVRFGETSYSLSFQNAAEETFSNAARTVGEGFMLPGGLLLGLALLMIVVGILVGPGYHLQGSGRTVAIPGSKRDY